MNTIFFLIIKNKQTLITFLLLFKTVILKHYVNILSIISILSASASCNCSYCWHLVLVVRVSDMAPRCRSRWASSLASRRRCCFVVVGSGIPSCGCIRRILRLVFVVVVFGYFIVGGVSLFLSLSDYRCWCRCRWVSYRQRRLVVVVVVGFSSSLLSLSAASRRSLKSLIYIRLNMRATTMDLQHLEKNGPAAL